MSPRPASVLAWLGSRLTAARGLRAELLVPGPLLGGSRLGRFGGRWTVQRGLVASAVTVPHAS
ncbi:hypothetical protein [Streptomyces sp. HGB0020]|uniref:hypothetical protein n=1 Tax=Streptomyces sp. HGB0020 TaxID=1078086 RepID=UPI0003A61034